MADATNWTTRGMGDFSKLDKRRDWFEETGSKTKADEEGSFGEQH